MQSSVWHICVLVGEGEFPREVDCRGQAHIRCYTPNAAAAEARGWWWSQDKTKWYMEQLAAHGMKVLPASEALKSGLQDIGERLTGEWLMRSGADGLRHNQRLPQAHNVIRSDAHDRPAK